MKKICLIMALWSWLSVLNLGWAQEENGKLWLCSSMGEQETQALIDNFQQCTGIRVRVTYLPAGGGDSRLDFLQEHPLDCWLGGRAEEYYLASRKGMLEPYKAPASYQIPASMRSREGYWTSLYLEYIAFISNKNNLRELGLYAPNTWQELLLPQLEGEIALADFYNGGASYAMITSLWQLEGEEQTLKFASRLNRQQLSYTKSYEEAVELVYSGAKTVTVVPLKYALHLEKEHPHLFATVVQDANRNLLTCVAIMDQVVHLEEAQAFIDYLLTEQSEKALREAGLLYYWQAKDYPYNGNRLEILGNIHVPVDDLEWTAGQKEKIISTWLAAE